MQVGTGELQLPEAKHVAFSEPCNMYPVGQLYAARCPSLSPSNLTVNGRVGGGNGVQFDTENEVIFNFRPHLQLTRKGPLPATMIMMLFVRPRGDAQV